MTMLRIKSFRSCSFFIVCFSIFLCTASELPNLSISEYEQNLINHVQHSIAMAEIGSSKLSADVLACSGMTSHKVKHFLNNLCSLEQAAYLEIGVWKGATFTAALHGNKTSIRQAVAIDNWSEFNEDKPWHEFSVNCKQFISDINYKFYDHECFTIKKDILFDCPINIYFYDGNHTAESQEKAFTYFNSLFAQTFIAIIDDWNHPPVSLGTQTAFKELGYTILFERVLPARFNGDTTAWWNGLYVAVVRRHS